MKIIEQIEEGVRINLENKDIVLSYFDKTIYSLNEDAIMIEAEGDFNEKIRVVVFVPKIEYLNNHKEIIQNITNFIIREIEYNNREFLI